MKLSRVFFGASLACLAVGLSQLAGEIATGFGLAMGGVFFVLGYITRALFRAEAMQS
jgi:hypothetical protein